jgi:hypothetical protein
MDYGYGLLSMMDVHLLYVLMLNFEREHLEKMDIQVEIQMET